MLTGEFQHNMDQKGRVTIPSKFRDDLGDSFHVCRGLDGCLFVLSLEQMQLLIEKAAQMPMAQAKPIQRFIFSGASVELDKQGRILIPQKLREYAGLDKDITVIGAGTRAEIWDTARWNSYGDALSEDAIETSMNLLNF